VNLELSETQRTLLERAVSFLAKDAAPSARAIDEAREVPRSLGQALADLGIVRVVLPKAQGGLGEGAQTSAILLEALARACASTAGLVSLQHHFIAGSLARFGSEAQQAAWLPGLASGEGLGAFALSEPDAGDALSALATTATPVGGDYVLDGEKSFVAWGGKARFAIVFARIPSGAASAFLVPTATPGVTVGPAYETLGLRGLPVVTMTLRGARIPAGNRLGAEGQGAAILDHALEGARIGVAAIALGLAQTALDLATQHALRTQVEGAPLANRQEVQFKIAEMSVASDAARMLVWQASALRDAGQAARVESAMAKTTAVEAAGKSAAYALQILGAKGLLPEASVERLVRDAKSLEICAGTPDSLSLAIASAVLND
jgi:alkylation response protein AidB-like acyl-CoA dehydrogenase